MNIHVTNLGEKITEESLQSVFANYGKVRSTKVINDRFSGYSRGFAFIEMPVKQEAEAAIAGLKGKALKGRSLDVNEARPREDRRPRRENTGWNRSRSSSSSSSIGHRY